MLSVKGKDRYLMDFRDVTDIFEIKIIQRRMNYGTDQMRGMRKRDF